MFIECETMCGPADPTAFSVMLHRLLVTAVTLLSIASLHFMTHHVSGMRTLRSGERAQPVNAW